MMIIKVKPDDDLVMELIIFCKARQITVNQLILDFLNNVPLVDIPFAPEKLEGLQEYLDTLYPRKM